MKRLYTDDDVRALIEQRGKRYATAIEAGISPPCLSGYMNGRKTPGPKLLRLLGLKEVRAYEAIR